MKKITIGFFLILMCTGRLFAQTYATVPYYTGFESGTFDSCWTTYSDLATNGVAIMTYDSSTWGVTQAHTGNYFMGMHYPNGGAYNTNQAKLHLDLSSASNLFFEFYWADFSDETETQDGVFFSQDGGATFTKVIDLPGENYTDLIYTRFYYNLDSLILANGLSPTSTFVIMFQQYDNYYFHGGNDGFLIDDVSITTCNPIADFSFSADSTGLTVNFTNLTNDTLATYYWDFGDGSNSTNYEPSHTYASPSTYTVCLSATNSCGSDTICQPVTVCIPLIVDFSASTDSTGATYTFTYTGTSSSGLTYEWDFGDSQIGSGTPVTHTYANGGVYVVTLTVTDLCNNYYFAFDTINVSFVSIDENIFGNIVQVYPNPGNGSIFINSGELHHALTAITIFNSEGKLIRTITGTELEHQPIEINNLEKGLYLISLSTVDTQISKMLIVE